MRKVSGQPSKAHMTAMQEKHPGRYDLNLLLVFEALMAHRNVSAAAVALGLTQPTLSHALSRLRKMCGDPLFVRTGKGMQPTAAAQTMAEPLEQALAQIRATLTHRRDFNPARDTRLFRLLLTDIGTVTFLPGLLAYLHEQAPGIGIETGVAPQHAYKQALESGEADLAIGQMPTLPTGFFQQRIFEDAYVCIVGAQHPRLKKAPSIEDYLREHHIRVQIPGRSHSVVDAALAERHLSRQIKVSVAQYLAILPILAATQLVATVPLRVFQAMRHGNGLRMYPLPFQVPTAVVRQFWHERQHADPAHAWLRATISALFAGTPPRHGTAA
jgi:DNA-binding transcriptional LysR family regulator